jgi:uncharacterized protein YecE (DUF72 family)
VRGTLRYGTSSWSEKSWVGPFYPPGTKPADFLTRYAEAFDTVEADVTWYRVPDAQLVDGWRRRTPEGFRIAAKFPRSIAHAGDGPRPDADKVLVPEHVGADLRDFLRGMALLGDRCGPLVLQLPFFPRDAFPHRDAFLERLERFLALLPDTFRYAVEVRNRDWVGPELGALLHAHRVALVLNDVASMPHPARVARQVDVVTTDFVYGRLIGDRRRIDALTETFDRIVLDQGPRLDAWADLLRALLERVPEAYVYANNHYAGHGPATIRDLAARVAARAADGAG